MSWTLPILQARVGYALRCIPVSCIMLIRWCACRRPWCRDFMQAMRDRMRSDWPPRRLTGEERFVRIEELRRADDST